MTWDMGHGDTDTDMDMNLRISPPWDPSADDAAFAYDATIAMLAHLDSLAALPEDGAAPRAAHVLAPRADLGQRAQRHDAASQRHDAAAQPTGHARAARGGRRRSHRQWLGA